MALRECSIWRLYSGEMIVLRKYRLAKIEPFKWLSFVSAYFLCGIMFTGNYRKSGS
jgi:hypothetical protein